MRVQRPDLPLGRVHLLVLGGAVVNDVGAGLEILEEILDFLDLAFGEKVGDNTVAVFDELLLLLDGKERRNHILLGLSIIWEAEFRNGTASL